MMKTTKIIIPILFFFSLFIINYRTLLESIISVHYETEQRNVSTNTELQIASPDFANSEQAIFERNIFNLSGTLLSESTSTDNDIDPMLKPCTQKQLPFQIIGIISSNRPGSGVVTLVNPALKHSEVYRPGDKIIGNISFLGAFLGQAQFYDGLDKICIPVAMQKSYTHTPQYSNSRAETYNLERRFVNNELGEGFATIMETTQFIPNYEGRKLSGFKFYDIEPDSLFSKLGLQADDVILKINNIQLNDAGQIYELFRAFKEDQTIELEVSRGSSVSTKRVNIR